MLIAIIDRINNQLYAHRHEWMSKNKSISIRPTDIERDWLFVIKKDMDEETGDGEIGVMAEILEGIRIESKGPVNVQFFLLRYQHCRPWNEELDDWSQIYLYLSDLCSSLHVHSVHSTLDLASKDNHEFSHVVWLHCQSLFWFWSERDRAVSHLVDTCSP